MYASSKMKCKQSREKNVEEEAHTSRNTAKDTGEREEEPKEEKKKKESRAKDLITANKTISSTTYSPIKPSKYHFATIFCNCCVLLLHLFSSYPVALISNFFLFSFFFSFPFVLSFSLLCCWLVSFWSRFTRIVYDSFAVHRACSHAIHVQPVDSKEQQQQRKNMKISLK